MSGNSEISSAATIWISGEPKDRTLNIGVEAGPKPHWPGFEHFTRAVQDARNFEKLLSGMFNSDVGPGPTDYSGIAQNVRERVVKQYLDKNLNGLLDKMMEDKVGYEAALTEMGLLNQEDK